jgi:hypothetical protein
MLQIWQMQAEVFIELLILVGMGFGRWKLEVKRLQHFAYERVSADGFAEDVDLAFFEIGFDIFLHLSVSHSHFFNDVHRRHLLKTIPVGPDDLTDHPTQAFNDSSFQYFSGVNPKL